MSAITVLFLYDDCLEEGIYRSYHIAAAKLGFRAIAVSVSAIQPLENVVRLQDAWEARPDGTYLRVFNCDTHVDVLVHRMEITAYAAAVIRWLIYANPNMISSFHNQWRRFDDKWYLEECFLKVDDSRKRVPRPRTFLIPKNKLETTLEKIGSQMPLIFKPSSGSVCRGIEISTPPTFVEVLSRVKSSRWRRFVVQELQQLITFRDRRIDLRVLVLIESFEPLKFTLPEEGIARVAAAPDSIDVTDQKAMLTGCTFQKRLGITPVNTSISELLSDPASGLLNTEHFWKRTRTVVDDALSALASVASNPKQKPMTKCFLLAGIDLLMIRNKADYEMLFLELNYAPDLDGWGVSVDKKLFHVHLIWLAAIQRRILACRNEIHK